MLNPPTLTQTIRSCGLFPLLKNWENNAIFVPFSIVAWEHRAVDFCSFHSLRQLARLVFFHESFESFRTSMPDNHRMRSRSHLTRYVLALHSPGRGCAGITHKHRWSHGVFGQSGNLTRNLNLIFASVVKRNPARLAKKQSGRWALSPNCSDLVWLLWIPGSFFFRLRNNHHTTG